MKALHSQLLDLERAQSRPGADAGSGRHIAVQAKRTLGELRALLHQLRLGLDEAQMATGQPLGAGELGELADIVADMLQDLAAQDKLGSFEIQSLMSKYNQAEQHASSIKKKVDDTKDAVIKKIS